MDTIIGVTLPSFKVPRLDAYPASVRIHAARSTAADCDADASSTGERWGGLRKADDDAQPRRVADPFDLRLVPVDHCLDECKSQSAARRGATLLAPLEASKNLLSFCHRNSRPGVAHRKHRGIARKRQGDLDRLLLLATTQNLHKEQRLAAWNHMQAVDLYGGLGRNRTTDTRIFNMHESMFNVIL